jgi:asparagine synthase (glutamine-hydrolysing)
MSFIYGIIDYDEKLVDEKELEALGNAVKHEGFSEKTLHLGSKAIGYCWRPDRQPNAGIVRIENIVVLADIRIYNGDILKTNFEFNNDTEAFAKAYLKWGIECANHINGDFSVVVIDNKQKKVLLFRDHIGARPLAYWFNGKRLIFASHEFGIAKSGMVTNSISEEKVICRLLGLQRNYQQTIFNDILKVIPGHCFSFSYSNKSLLKYWRPESIGTNHTLTYNEAVIRLRQLMVKATLSRIEPGTIGAHVSGGLDSTGIAAIIADNLTDKERFIGYSWTPANFNQEVDGFNEKELIEAFANDKGVRIRYRPTEGFNITEYSISPEFERMSIELPTMRMAAQDSVTTIFSGWGGDEFVSLSTRGLFNHLFFSFKWLQLLQYIRKNGIKWAVVLSRQEVLPLFVPFGLLPAYGSKDWSFLELLKRDFILKHWKLMFFHKRTNLFGYGNRSKFIQNLLQSYHIPRRMDCWTFHSESFGFTYKYPLLDKDLLEYWFSLPVEFTFHKMEPRLLYRDVLNGILTEEVRIRKGKDESLMMTFNIQSSNEGLMYLKQIFDAASEEQHLTFFDTNAYNKLSEMPSKGNERDGRVNKFAFYLRHLAVANKYCNNSSS